MNYESLDEALRPLDPGSLQSVIFSNPIPSKTKYRKIRAERNGSDFFVSSFTVTQVFHETVPADRILLETDCPSTSVPPLPSRLPPWCGPKPSPTGRRTISCRRA